MFEQLTEMICSRSEHSEIIYKSPAAAVLFTLAGHVDHPHSFPRRCSSGSDFRLELHHRRNLRPQRCLLFQRLLRCRLPSSLPECYSCSGWRQRRETPSLLQRNKRTQPRCQGYGHRHLSKALRILLSNSRIFLHKCTM